MNTENTIRELVKVHLSDNHNVDGVQFIDQLLLLASEAGEIQCALAGERKLRFQIPGQPAWEVELERAKAKLRMLCAQLGVLCKEAGDPDVSLYGGEGIIKKEAPVELPNNLGRLSGSGLRSSTGTSLASPPIWKAWRVRFTNTPSEQEFTLTGAVR